ncbi:hypothetical protein [Marinagarivorans cellulosilyticus]|uniref:Type IV pili sensor histidine kinase and response regulator n=1 Tax=Marinagarivorans cellulosilyticus TaxID=2721545 RepID=A0AAN1WHH0_9GAMM|nr:hypothetical protein [Marinagarivorans cellulosilyticus]BCD97673.1 type IV pili sensor histidine kinase and response regulator [Marinagarivorans cellulosilyticus]
MYKLRVLGVAMLLPAMAIGETLQIDDEPYVRTDRYTLVSIETQPEQISPLLSIVEISFSQHINSVGRALDELLVGSGYTWNKEMAENDRLNRLSLPVVVRDIGPVRLRDALITVVGEAWNLQVNELTREVWFEPREI